MLVQVYCNWQELGSHKLAEIHWIAEIHIAEIHFETRIAEIHCCVENQNLNCMLVPVLHN
jgi:hypothetical protein